jgi:peptide/nickel transport system permease protein
MRTRKVEAPSRASLWMTIYPGLAIAITVLAVNMFGDGLRTALDPRMKID